MESVLAAAQRRADETLRLLRRWVEQDSFSGDVVSVNAMGALLEQVFALPELAMERRRGDGVGDHRFWKTPAWDGAGQGRVLLVGHHDTVFPPGTFTGWREDGDKVRGPGVLDMKGGLAIIHCALASLSECGRLAGLPIGVVCVGDEEIGSSDSRELTEEVARGAGCALVFEAGRAEDAIITRRKGTGGIVVKVTGKAAHAGNYHADGVNAIWALAQFVDAAQRRTDYDRGLTVNVGTIAGGTSRNTVPASAECGIDFRFVRADDGHALVAALDKIAREIAATTGAKFELVGGVRRPPLERTDASYALYERYAAAARASGLGAGESPMLGGGSDGNNIAALGVPVIDGLGPRGFGFHTPDEYIEPASVAMRVEALLRFLLG